jgi:hypothetical protein
MKLVTFLLMLLSSSHALADIVPSISVRGDGEAEVAPDYVRVSAAIVSDDEDTERAKQDVDRRMQKVVDAMASLNIQARDVVLSGASVTPTYKYDRNENEIPTGYRVTRMLELKLREIASYEKLIQALVSSGVDEIQHAASEMDDDNELKRLALQHAAANAKRNATTVAQALNVKLGDPIEISDERLLAPSPLERYVASLQETQMDARSVSDPLVFIPENIKATATIWVRFKVLPQDR